jgi:hypothetical protein
VFTGFSFLHPPNPFFPTRVDEYSSQFTDSFGKEANQKISTLGSVEVPGQFIPEPSIWLLLVLACLGVVVCLRLQPRQSSA